MKRDYYEILGVSKSASADEIKKANASLPAKSIAGTLSTYRLAVAAAVVGVGVLRYGGRGDKRFRLAIDLVVDRLRKFVMVELNQRGL